MTATSPRHRLKIEFCTQCKFQGRAFWLARELFDSRPDLVEEIVLVPSSGGVFAGLWDYATAGRFPEPKEIREAVLAASGREPTPRPH